jgi:hypothetical protein
MSVGQEEQLRERAAIKTSAASEIGDSGLSQLDLAIARIVEELARAAVRRQNRNAHIASLDSQGGKK